MKNKPLLHILVIAILFLSITTTAGVIGVSANVESTSQPQISDDQISAENTGNDPEIIVTVNDSSGQSDNASIPISVGISVGENNPATSTGAFENSNLLDDVNGDNDLDNLDVITLFQQKNSDVVQQNDGSFDFNDDGKVDNLDVIALFNKT